MLDMDNKGGSAAHVELGSLPSGTVGPADIYVVHAWDSGGTWGDIVAACADYCPKGYNIWIDLFAVRQWPGNLADLPFMGIVQRCKAVLQVIPGGKGGKGGAAARQKKMKKYGIEPPE